MPSSHKGTPVPARKAKSATMSPKMAKRVSKKMAKHVDISSESKHQAAHDKLDALLHSEKLEHIAKRRAKHMSH